MDIYLLSWGLNDATFDLLVILEVPQVSQLWPLLLPVKFDCFRSNWSSLVRLMVLNEEAMHL
jgi:hypothetical protein